MKMYGGGGIAKTMNSWGNVDGGEHNKKISDASQKHETFNPFLFRRANPEALKCQHGSTE